jgi:FtsZ-binding cell division protein ZapB
MDNYVQYVLEVEELKKEIAKLKKRVQEAEGEVTIIRGIGMNSPEFRALKKENEELKEDNKKLAEQVSDKNNFVERLRSKGLI